MAEVIHSLINIIATIDNLKFLDGAHARRWAETNNGKVPMLVTKEIGSGT